MKYITNGRLVLPDKILENSVLVFDEKIVDIIDAKDIPSKGEIIDAKGNFVSPGLIDLHIHGYLGEDVSDGKVQGITKIANGIMQKGVTSFYPTTMTLSYKEIGKALDTVRRLKPESKNWQGAEILGVNLEGPFINPAKKGAQKEENIKKLDADFVIKNSDIIGLVTVAPETENCIEEIAKIRNNSNVIISIGHSNASFEDAEKGIDAGATHITHLFNAQSPLNHRNPGVVGAALLKDVTVELIADKFHLHPALFKLIAKIKEEKTVLITDCTRAGGMPNGEYTLGGQPIILNGVECRLKDGTIAGSVLELNKAVKNVLDNTDLPVYSVLSMASLNPAKAVGVQGKKGSLEVGKDADIVIFDGEFNVLKTLIGGKIKYENTDL